MATVTQEPTEYTADSTVQTTLPTKTHIELCDADDIVGLINLKSTVMSTITPEVKSRTGAKTLVRSIDSYLRSHELVATRWQSIVNSTNRMNGQLSPTQKIGYKKKSARAMAEVFYNGLTTPSLRMHCGLFGLSYDSFDSIEQVVEALVTKHIETNVIS